MRSKAARVYKRTNKSGSISWGVEVGIVDGKRRRKFFRTKVAANEHAALAQRHRDKHGETGLLLSQQQLLEAEECFKRLKPHGVSLNHAVSYFIDRAQPDGGRKAVREVVSELLKQKERAGVRPKYLKELTCKFSRFCGKFGDRAITDIVPSEMSEWLYGLSSNKQTVKNYRREIGLVFNFAVSQKWCKENPILRTVRPIVPGTKPGVFKAIDAYRLLLWASRKDRALVPYLAIGLFAGLRSCELERLQWRDVRPEEGHISVEPEKSKTASRRTVTILPNLKRWLEPFVKDRTPAFEAEKLVPKPVYYRMKKLLRPLSLTWKQNAMRHSCASYHLALFRNAATTSTELGHESPRMLHAHYNTLVSRDAAVRYWSVVPGSRITGRPAAFDPEVIKEFNVAGTDGAEAISKLREEIQADRAERKKAEEENADSMKRLHKELTMLKHGQGQVSK